MVKENLEIFRDELAEAAKSAGRKPEDISIVAVSKLKGIDMITEAFEAGQRHFGENYAQELREKASELNDINWHFIGQLQSNKVKYIVDKVYLIQSVDRLSLAKEINKRAAQANIAVDVLLQLYPLEDEGRGGAGVDELKQLLQDCADLTNIRIKGIMSVATFGLDENQLLRYFETVRNAYENLSAFCPDNARMDILSTGMTDDYIQAIKQGSNMVRIGRAIFGERSIANGG